jgi:hypothetical protein
MAKRVGADKLAEMLQEKIAIAVKDKQVTPQELAQVNVDTTVQKKTSRIQQITNCITQLW